MKLALVSAIIIVATLSAPTWANAVTWTSKFDARPEAVLTGGALLALASILRRNHARRSAR